VHATSIGMLVPFPVVFESTVTIWVVMQESERTTFTRNRCTRMLNFGGGISFRTHIYSYVHKTCLRLVLTLISILVSHASPCV
jgi:hypothetical protein